MANLGTAYVQIAPSTQGLAGAIDKAFQGQGTKQGKQIGDNAGKGYIASGFTKAVVGAFAGAIAAGVALVAKNFDSAVKRYDTLNNFPKVMANFGIEGDKADAAMKRLNNSIMGLPTTLDSAALGVQRLTARTGDVDKATDIFLALNNAVIAGAAPMELQATATEQFTQAFSKGKIDMMEWRSMMSAMPAQLNQVAIAMGYGSDGVDKLGEDLREGNVSMDEFADAIVNLNTEGVSGFQNFAEQAENAIGGVGTAINLMETAVTRGVAKLIEGLDKGFKKAGFEGFGEVLQIIGVKIEELFGKIGEKIPAIIGAFQTLMPVLMALAPIFAIITLGILAYNAAVFIMTTYQKLAALATGLMTAAQWLFNAALLASPITWVVLGIAALVAAFIILWNKSEGFRNFFINMGEQIKAKFTAVVEALKGFFTETLPNAFENFKTKVSTIITTVVAFFKELPGKVIAAVASLPGKILTWAKSIPPKVKEGFSTIKSVGGDLVKGLWNGISDKVSWVLDKIRGFGKSILNGIKKIFGVDSPSKEFAWIGKMLGLGFGEGMFTELSRVEDEIQPTMDSLLSEFSQGAEFDAVATSRINHEVSSDYEKMGGMLMSGLKLIADKMGNYKVEFDKREVARMVEAVS